MTGSSVVELSKDDRIILEKYYETLISDHIDMVVCNTMPTVSQDETYFGNISDDLDAELGLLLLLLPCEEKAQ